MATQKQTSVLITKSTSIPKILRPDITSIKWDISNPLPKLPKKLEQLCCNSVIELPEILPETLEILWCDSVTELPELPKGLKRLICNGVKVLPEILPEGLSLLICNSVTTLPELPDTLMKIQCDSVKVLPKLPEGLMWLCCDSVTTLPEVLPKGLKGITYNNGKRWKKLTCINSILAIILREARLEIGLDEASISSRLNKLPGYVAAMESGRENITTEYLYGISREFCFSVSTLINCLDKYSIYLSNEGWVFINKDILEEDDLLIKSKEYYESDQFKKVLAERSFMQPGMILNSFLPSINNEVYISDFFKYITSTETH